MIATLDYVLATIKYGHAISQLKWSDEYQPVTPPLLNKHWYSDGIGFIDDMVKDLVGVFQLEGIDTIAAS